MTWNPDIYMRFGNERSRAAADLLARVPLEQARLAVDLGCGPGNSTDLLAARFPEADLIGVDTSREMLERARADGPKAAWIEADADSYRPPAETDLLFSNATLHWLPDHETLFPALLETLKPGAALAVQMPDNFAAPSHTLLQELAHTAPWDRWLANLRPARPVAAAQAYFDWLSPLAERLDIWTTEYCQVLSGPDPVLNWVRGTALTPFLAALPENEHDGFLEAYRSGLTAAYPARADGRTLFPFRRLFMIGIRKAISL